MMRFYGAIITEPRIEDEVYPDHNRFSRVRSKDEATRRLKTRDVIAYSTW